MTFDSYLRQHLKFARWQSGTNHQAKCPRADLHKHGDRDPSLSVDVEKGLLKCFGCGLEGNVYQVAKELGWPPPPGYVPNGGGLPTNRRSASRSGPEKAISEELINEMHAALTAAGRHYLKTQRLLTDRVINDYKLGVAEGRLIIPIRDEAGICRDCRRWLRPEKRTNGAPKILHWAKGCGSPRLYPTDQLQHERLLLLEGELDVLAANANGYAAVTVTAGAATWLENASDALSGKTVTVVMDNDESGRRGPLSSVPSPFLAVAVRFLSRNGHKIAQRRGTSPTSSETMARKASTLLLRRPCRGGQRYGKMNGSRQSPFTS